MASLPRVKRLRKLSDSFQNPFIIPPLMHVYSLQKTETAAYITSAVSDAFDSFTLCPKQIWNNRWRPATAA